ncbi:MAG TPA: hypothetical protein VMW43_10000 [Bacteroidota bacterium]|nr:hypothetical protein [Bacteroidota bacterium]
MFLHLAALLTILSYSPPAPAGDTSGTRHHLSGIEGQIYTTGPPAITVDWTPLPLRIATPLIILGKQKDTVRTLTSDERGRFRVLLPPGEYYILLRQSMIPRPQGLYLVPPDSLIRIRLFFDTGIR